MSLENEVSVLYRDRDLLVVHKPAGLATTAMDRSDCLVERAHVLDPAAPRLHPTSRLDASVTGIVTFARTRVATEALLEARRQGRYRRLYVAIAAATPKPSIGRWREPIGIDPRDRRLRKVHSKIGLKEASTDYEVVAEQEHATLMYLRPRTGRTHQLRVHAAAAGAPLLGDVAYGGPRRVVLPSGRVVTARNVMLHCAYVGIPHVSEPGQLDLFDPPPDSMRRCWSALGGTEEAWDKERLVSAGSTGDRCIGPADRP